MKKAEKEKAEALEFFRDKLKPGDIVYTVLRHVSRSGMLREIGVLLPCGDSAGFWHPNYATASLIGATVNKRGDGVRVTGCGMDMGFHIVYNLSHALFPNGFGCIGERCPSNDHSNGDRDYTPHAEQFTAETCPGKPCGTGCDHKSSEGRPHWHKSGEYALRHSWV
jgi:hypothetical protein